jgi:uncharacterized protein YndB with AHSA1/START domain
MTVTHGTFVIDRSYPSPLKRVFQACADPAAKAQWFGAPTEQGHEMDFRVGGREYSKGSHEGLEFVYDAQFQDIVENERIVSTYYMLMNGQRISVSVATMEFRAEGDATAVTYTEQGVFLDGFDTVDQREAGTRELLGALGTYLQA